MTDEEIILNHSVSVRPRARIELAIVNQLLLDAANNQFILEVEDMEDEDGTVKDHIFNLDMARVYVRKVVDLHANKSGKNTVISVHGWILLVLGNSGYDIISDYTTNLEEFLKNCNALADKFENGMF